MKQEHIRFLPDTRAPNAFHAVMVLLAVWIMVGVHTPVYASESEEGDTKQHEKEREV